MTDKELLELVQMELEAVQSALQTAQYHYAAICRIIGEMDTGCGCGCGLVEPFGFVPEAGCPVHDPEV